MARFPAYAQSTKSDHEQHNYLVRLLNNFYAAPDFSVGAPTLSGTATVWDDKEMPLTGARIDAPASKVVTSTNNLVAYTTNCALTDYVGMNIQMSHSKKLYSPVYPHLHWNQDSTKLVNWLVEYRWVHGGKTIPSTWSYSTISMNVYPLTAGTAQITDFVALDPTTNEGLSSILQVKIKRDSSNASGKFASTDPYGASAFAMSFDVHYERDSMGSDQVYVK